MREADLDAYSGGPCYARTWRSRIAAGVVGLLILAGAVIVIRSIGFEFWEKTLRGPFDGIVVQAVDQPKIDSKLDLPGEHVIEVSNAYTNAGGDDWPLVVLKNREGVALWGRVLQPIVKYPVSGTNDRPFLRDVKLLKSKKGSDIKVIFSCNWGGGGMENGIIYLERESLGFKKFAVSW